MNKQSKKILFIIDPLEKLSLEWDNSLCLLREFCRRGYFTYASDCFDLFFMDQKVYAYTKRLKPLSAFQLEAFPKTCRPLRSFDLVIIRKEPPFDINYLYLTQLLDLESHLVAMANHPRGIRNANEKLSALNFSHEIPETLVTSSTARILEFQKKIGTDLIIKPLDQKGGRGICKLKLGQRRSAAMLSRATLGSKKFVVAQRFIQEKNLCGDKRIVVLNGEILTAYEKRPRTGDFRANLSRGGTHHPTRITAKEQKLVAKLKPYLLREGLLLTGLDVMDEKLLEINVTSPAGITEAKSLYPNCALVEVWANSLEALAHF